MKRKIPVLIVLAVLVLLAGLSIYTVNEKEFAIITRFGDPVRTIDQAGPHRKLPGFLEKVNRLDKRIHVFKTRPLQLLLGDKNPIIMTCYVCWKISRPLAFFQSVTTLDNAQQKLGDMINARLGSVLGDYSLSQIINVDPEKVKLTAIEDRILEECNQQSGEKYGLEVVDVGIRRISYPAIVTEAVYNRMKAEREKEAKKYRAEGGEAAAMIEAEADKEVAKILSEAYKESEITRGEGDSEAIRIYGEAYSQGEDFYDFLGSLEAYKEIFGRKTTLILSTGSELFRYLVPRKMEQAEVRKSTE